MKRAAITVAFVLITAAAFAQSLQPYADLQSRAVKALSDQQIADLRAGRGMSMALPAELNGYPGPMHVLEHADALGLTTAQRDRTVALIASMKAETVPMGERLIEQETRLDSLFAKREITVASLTAVTEEIGLTQARLREAHLKFHLAMMDVLTPPQLETYGTLRGYTAKSAAPHQHNR
jgi:Spy/CpxP family protein refolding chaperone